MPTESDGAKPLVTAAGVFQGVEKGRQLDGSGLRENGQVEREILMTDNSVTMFG